LHLKHFIVTAAVLSNAMVSHAVGAQEPLKIGAVYALTGPVAPYGVAQQKALQLRTDELNAKGGLKGRKIQVFFYDTEGNGNKAVQFTRKAIESDKVDIILGPSTSGEALLAAPIANDAKVPLISHSGAQTVVDPARPYVFQTAQYDRVAVPVALQEFKRLGYSKVALLSSTDGYGQSGTAVLQELAPKYGISIVLEQFDRQDTDMTAQVLRARQSNVDVMLIWSTFPAPAIILRNAKAAGFTKPIYNSFAMATPDFLNQAGPNAENSFVMSAALLLPEALSDSHPSKKAVMEEYQEFFARYKEAPTPSAQHALDAMSIIEDSVKRIDGDVNRQSLRDAIERTDIFGANGHFKFSTTDHGVSTENAPIVFLLVKSGKFTANR
jgi:branched-chain amino acid transport system substrate-binding protein